MSFRAQLTALLALSTVVAASSAQAAGGDSKSFNVTSTLKPLHITGECCAPANSRASPGRSVPPR